MAVTTPTVETTKDFILIKIPRRMFSGRQAEYRKLSLLEEGLRESLREVKVGKLHGPFKSVKLFLRALKKPVR